MDDKKKLARQQALADACAGVAASLFSLWIFYPVDVFKIRAAAAQHHHHHQEGDRDTAYDQEGDEKRPKSFHDTVKDMYAGWRMKSLSAAASSFCYFYLYSWIVTISRQYSYQQRIRGNNNNNNETNNIPPSSRLLVLSAAAAAMMNTLITLPLDVLSSRIQAKGISSLSSKVAEEKYDEEDEDEEAEDRKKGDPTSSHQQASALEDQPSQKRITFKRSDSSVVEEFMSRWKLSRASSFVIPQQQPSQQPRAKSSSSSSHSFSLNDAASLWKGLFPSLLLCTNPTIHYAVFDTIKCWILSSSSSIQSSNDQNDVVSSGSLSMSQAFLLGLVAKFVSTIATYPLIRAKVMIMLTSKTSMIGCLVDEYQRHGPMGLYRGCSIQLLHTLLKSAVLMMFRERIARTTRRLILPEQRD